MLAGHCNRHAVGAEGDVGGGAVRIVVVGGGRRANKILLCGSIAIDQFNDTLRSATLTASTRKKREKMKKLVPLPVIALASPRAHRFISFSATSSLLQYHRDDAVSFFFLTALRYVRARLASDGRYFTQPAPLTPQ